MHGPWIREERESSACGEQNGEGVEAGHARRDAELGSGFADFGDGGLEEVFWFAEWVFRCAAGDGDGHVEFSGGVDVVDAAAYDAA